MASQEDTPSVTAPAPRARFTGSEHATTESEPVATDSIPAAESPAAEDTPTDPVKSALDAKLAHFNRLKQKAAAIRKENFKAAQEEAKRVATDPNLIAKLERKRLNATEKLLKEETVDFERKRAWDWTAEESEKWDRHLEKKQKHRENVAFANYSDEASKAYRRRIKDLPPAEQDEILKRRQGEIDRAVARGDLELVDDEDGTVRVVDKKGTFYVQPEQYQFDHKPSKESVDRLVAAMEKEEAKRLKNRGQRARKEENGDVTYINDKNKQFNEKLARFYNKYTSETRDSFERGTAM
jgi:pre-mRNA-splicing factor SYF2